MNVNFTEFWLVRCTFNSSSDSSAAAIHGFNALVMAIMRYRFYGNNLYLKHVKHVDMGKELLQNGGVHHAILSSQLQQRDQKRGWWRKKLIAAKNTRTEQDTTCFVVNINRLNIINKYALASQPRTHSPDSKQKQQTVCASHLKSRLFKW